MVNIDIDANLVKCNGKSLFTETSVLVWLNSYIELLSKKKNTYEKSLNSHDHKFHQ